MHMYSLLMINESNSGFYYAAPLTLYITFKVWVETKLLLITDPLLRIEPEHVYVLS